MTERSALTYKDAGVDIDAKMQAIERIKGRAGATFGGHAGPIGHFGGTWRLPAGPDRIMVASADGVGTKLRLAFVLGGDAHARVGADIVNHCVNDILALGASPLFFLDYFAAGALDPDVLALVVGGIADACQDAGMALLGGETAEMPDMYRPGEYDLAGFIVGEVAPDRTVDGSSVRPGDVVIGLPSDGLHTNGYSLARRIAGLTGDPGHDRAILAQPLPGGDESIGVALMRGHRSYLRDVQPLLAKGIVRGMAHITGGGLRDNLPRCLPETCIAKIVQGSWSIPPVFEWLVTEGDVPVEEQYRVFNMGIGFTLIVRPIDAESVTTALPEARVIGAITPRVTSDEAAVQGLSC